MKTRIHLGQAVQGAEKETQFLSAIEDTLAYLGSTELLEDG